MAEDYGLLNDDQYSPPKPGPWRVTFIWWPRQSYFDGKRLWGKCCIRDMFSPQIEGMENYQYCAIAQAAAYNLTGGELKREDFVS